MNQFVCVSSEEFFFLNQLLMLMIFVGCKVATEGKTATQHKQVNYTEEPTTESCWVPVRNVCACVSDSVRPILDEDFS